MITENCFNSQKNLLKSPRNSLLPSSLIEAIQLLKYIKWKKNCEEESVETIVNTCQLVKNMKGNDEALCFRKEFVSTT